MWSALWVGYNNNNNNKSLLRMNLQSDVQVYKYRNENLKKSKN